jgi:hypothetical protein
MSIGFNPNHNWFYGNGKAPKGWAKFRYALMHELGHHVGLGHVNEKGQTMFPTVANDEATVDSWCESDTFTSEEIEVMSSIVRNSQKITFIGCGIKPMSIISNPDDIYV